MTIRHFKIFIMVVQCESITLAANRLYMSQPAVSLAIREMEDYYGVKLFDRLSRKIYITDEGRRVYQIARQIIKEVDDLRDQLRSGQVQTTLRIGSSMTVGSYYIPRILNEYHKANPQVNVICTIDNSGNLTDLVLNNKLDLAITEGPVLSKKIASRVIKRDDLYLIMANNNPLAARPHIKIADLSDQKLLLRDKNSGTRKIIDSIFMAHDIAVEPVIESSSTMALIEAVRYDVGISFVPGQYLKLAGEHDIVKKKIDDVNLERYFTIIYQKNKYLNQPLIQLITVISRLLNAD